MKIGFVGLGNMGSAMARNLVKAGHAVTVYNRSRARAEEFSSIASTPAEAATGDAVITMLADDHAVESVGQELVKAMPPGAIHISMSTVSPALSERMHQAHTKAGQGYVAAPVLGRPEAAAEAKLFILTAGPAAAIAACRPIFEAIGRRTFTIGQNPPAANVVKLSCNFLLAAAIESLAEAFAWTRKSGIDPQIYLELLTATLFTAPVYKTYGRLIAEEAYTPAGFKMPLGLKDMRLALAAAENAAVPLPMASLIHDHMVGALALGMENLDWSALGRVAAMRAGIAPL